MSGRIENDYKIKLRTEYKLSLMPDYVSEWYYHLVANKAKSTTCYNYINKVYQLLHFVKEDDIKNVKVEDLTPMAVERYIIHLQTGDGKLKKTSDAYQANAWSCLNNFFEFLSDRDYTKENIIKKAGLRKPRVRDEVKRVHLTKDDFSKIIETVSYRKNLDPIKCRDTAILLLFMTTGMRKTALNNIDVKDINLESSSLNSIEIIDKGERKHNYILTKQVKKALKEWLDVRPLLLDGEDDGALFISYQGKRLSGNSIYKIVNKWTEEALGYKLSPHKLRGGFITIMIDETGDIAATSEAVGHRDVRTTQRYYASIGKGKTLAAKIMEDI